MLSVVAEFLFLRSWKLNYLLVYHLTEGGLTSSHVMEETGEFQHDDNMMPSHTMKSPAPPLSPFTPFAPAPRGVLKHSISQDSQSTETLTKRVSENSDCVSHCLPVVKNT